MPDQPNLLFVFSDQHRWADLGCYGNEQVISPHLDRFADSAVRFNNCISNSPLCCPARGSMLTGLLPMRHGAISNDMPMRHGVTSVADVLTDAGYHTGYVGKWHLAGVPRDQFIPAGEGRFGFAEWKVAECTHAYFKSYYFDEENRRFDINGYEPVEQTSLAIDFIQRNRGKPWALVLSWGPPHDPYHLVPEQYLDLYRGVDIALRENVPTDLPSEDRTDKTREAITEEIRGAYAHITALDEQFGRLMAALQATGQLSNTIVVFTSDHGDMLGSQGYEKKQLPYEESIRVPLLVSWPGRTVTGASDELIGLVDLPVSLVGLMGHRFPREVDGRDVHDVFTSPAAKGVDDCYIFDLVPCHQAARRWKNDWRGVRTRRHTFARTPHDEGYILYDNLADPCQKRNLIDDAASAGIRQELLARVNELAAKHDALLPWDTLVRQFGFKDDWNRSQAYFRLPLLE